MIDRVLIVGLGSIGLRHLRIARQLLPDADIRVLRHQTCSEAPEFANGCFSSLDQALSFRPDLSVIASPAPFHLQTALPLAQIGSHLLIEKPIAVSLEEVQPLLDISEQGNVVIQVGYNLRFLSTLQKFRQLIHDGLVGRVWSFQCEVGQYLPDWRANTDYRNSVSARSELGGGVLLELSHELDYVRWIFGEIQWIRATLSQQSNLDINVEDSAYLTIGFSSAARESLKGLVSLDFIRQDVTRKCQAIGEHGSLRWNGVTGVVEHFDAAKRCWETIFHELPARDTTYLVEWKDFIRNIKNNTLPSVTVRDGMAVLKVINAARHSASLQGKQVEIGR